LFADKIASDFGKFYLPMKGGVEPLFSIITAAITLFTNDSLLAGRLVNVVASAAIVLWIFKFSKLLNLNKNVRIITVLLYLASPAIILNERVANLDILSLCFFAWTIYFFISCLLNGKKTDYIFLFIISFSSFFTKPVAFLSIPLLLFIPVYLKNIRRNNIFKACALLFAAFIAVLFINLHYPEVFVTSASHLLLVNLFHTDSLDKIKLNTHLVLYWLDAYFPLSVICFASLFTVFTKTKKSFLFIMWLFSVLFVLIISVRNFFPRHILVSFIPLFFLTAMAIDGLSKKSKIVAGLFLLTLLFWEMRISFSIIADPENAAIAKEDHFQFFEDYTSGNKVKNVEAYLNQVASKKPNKKIYVYLDTTSIYRYALSRDYKNNSQIVMGEENLTSNVKSDELHYFIANKFFPDNTVTWKQIKTIEVSDRHNVYIYRY
jgi:hypothetical protein